MNPTVPFHVLNFLSICACMWHNWNHGIFTLMISKYGMYILNRDNLCISHAPTLLHAMTWSYLWDKRQCQVKANMIITQDFIKYLLPKSVPWVINQQMKLQAYCLNYFVHQSVLLLSVKDASFTTENDLIPTREQKTNQDRNAYDAYDLIKHRYLECTW